MTPPFGGAGHWEGSGKHWEQFGSGYGQVDGDVWYELVETKDDGYDDPDTTEKIFTGYPLTTDTDYKKNDVFDPEDEGFIINPDLLYYYDGDGKPFQNRRYYAKSTDDLSAWVWRVLAYYYGHSSPPYQYSLYANLVITKGAHHEILNDYWNTYIYRNLEWTKTNTDLIKRSHV